MGIFDAAEPKFDVENIIIKMVDSIWRLYFLRKGYFLILARIGSLLLVIILNPPFFIMIFSTSNLDSATSKILSYHLLLTLKNRF